jgi:hypothetical protein
MPVASQGHFRNWSRALVPRRKQTVASQTQGSNFAGRMASVDQKIGKGIGALLSGVGAFLGAIGALIVYFGVWIAAADSAGWVIGIALGWIPAAIAAGIVWVLLRYGWWLLLLIGIYIYNH